jgi:hypothetical protein
MSEQSSQGRGAAEELSGAPDTPEEHNAPASPSSTPGGDARARGASEDLADAPRTE